MAFKNDPVVRVMAVGLSQFVFVSPFCAGVSVATIHSVVLLRYQMENWIGHLVDFSDPYTRLVINLLDSTGTAGILYAYYCFAALTLEPLILLSIMVKALR